MIIAVGNDHAAIELKETIKEHLIALGHEVIDCGINKGEKADYPVMGEKVARMVADKQADAGIAMCGTGIGISIAANKVKGIRAACCSEPYSAKMAKEHNNANVLCFGARVIGDELAKMITDTWLNAEFQGGRHAKRVDLISAIDNKENR